MTSHDRGLTSWSGYPEPGASQVPGNPADLSRIRRGALSHPVLASVIRRAGTRSAPKAAIRAVSSTTGSLDRGHHAPSNAPRGFRPSRPGAHGVTALAPNGVRGCYQPTFMSVCPIPAQPTADSRVRPTTAYAWARALEELSAAGILRLLRQKTGTFNESGAPGQLQCVPPTGAA